ncbi:hypothetical protein HC028_15700 [Planosporangium flavigriseum]|uniref:LPXTG-motif cell wall anchor domain-containing protein n=1 Tax=Planosporangium flavigriseum TaxID=373681 RepID=A0A8J3LYC8_9ACTN|nr:hypothetical protein [Planosporangium flavigriseum]NJC65935.1 hypothetical protein [Planosporangium flavigriseum]GIG75640.1 hypothetical protein Pfl04_40440 [Planosporangium flavigriseum]
MLRTSHSWATRLGVVGAVALAMAALPAAGANAADTPTVAAQKPGITATDGVHLVALEPTGDLGSVLADETRYVPMSFTNTGTSTVNGATLTFTFDPDLQPAEYVGCTYTTSTSHLTVATCQFNEQLAPDTEWRFITDDGTEAGIDGYEVHFEADAYGPKVVNFSVTANDGAGAMSAKSSNGKKRFKLKAVEQQRVAKARATAQADSFTDGLYEVANSYDLEAIGAKASGKVGDVVKITIGEKNNGPASLDWYRAGSEPGARFQFVVPQGVQVVKAPNNCESVIEEGSQQRVERGAAGGTFYRCWTIDRLAAGETVSASFELKLTQAVSNASGTVSFDDPYANPEIPRPADTNPDNDKAAVVITAVAEAANPGTGGGNPATGGTGGGSGVTLPITGSQAGLAGGVGLALLAAGAGLYLVATRRRAVVVTGDDKASD